MRNQGLFDMRGFLSTVIACLLFVAAFTNRAESSETISIGGTGAALGSIRHLANAYSETHPGIVFEVLPSLGSSGGIKALMGGRVQIAISSRPLTGAELDQSLMIFPYAKTPVALATPKSNPVEQLDSSELVEIIAGERTRWPDGTAIGLVLRPAHSAETRNLLSIHPEIVTYLEGARRRHGVPVAGTVGEAAELIQSHKGGLGTTSLSVILSEELSLKPLSLDGVSPTLEAVESGQYQLVKTFNLITNSTPGASVQRFIDFVFSPKGESILRETGNVAIKRTG